MNERRYENYAVIQKQSAKKLFDIIKHIEYESAIDVGAGTGFMSIFLKNYVAFDIDKTFKTFHKNFVVGNVEDMPFKDKSFSLVVSNFCLHLCNFENAVKEILRISKRYVACAFPISGSLEDWIYDFPSKEEVFWLLKSKNICVMEENVYPLNLSGIELLRFINVTGKPKSRKMARNLTKSEIKHILSKLKNPTFNVLSFLLEV